MIKSLIRKLAGSAGYKISSTKYMLKQFDADHHILKLDFDHVLSKYLIHHKQPGSDFIFIQIGAFDGVQCDPLISYIDKYNWKGVMLEPQPAPYAKLKERYDHNKRIAIRNSAISPSSGKTVLYTLEGDSLPSWSKGMASFSKENILKHNYIFPDINNHIKEINVDTIAFEQLLAEESISSLDLLQVDTEGYDAEIIKMFPFDKVKPKIIHFESKHIPKTSLEDVLDLLIGHDYKIARDREEDMMAVL
jgi:FkbM family methyltransferase